MKTFYASFLFIFITFYSYAQTYSYGIVNISDYDFKIVAIPDFDASTDASDMGFTLVLPAGNADVINVADIMPSTIWSAQQYDAAFLTSQGLGDGSVDVFQFNNPPGQSLIAHTAGEQIDLVSFSISNMPTSGELTFLDNSDPIAVGAGGVLDSFYNSNIDNTTTQDYFAGYAPGLTTFMFNTLGINSIALGNSLITVFPNPTLDFVTINSNVTIDYASLYDVTGKEVLTSTKPTTISLSNLPSGVYLLKLYAKNVTVVKRIVKL